MDPDHYWQFLVLVSATKPGSDDVQVQAILRHFSDVTLSQWRGRLPKRLRTSDSRLGRINHFSGLWHVWAWWFEPVLSARVLSVRNTVEVLDAIALNTTVPYAARGTVDVKRMSCDAATPSEADQ